MPEGGVSAHVHWMNAATDSSAFWLSVIIAFARVRSSSKVIVSILDVVQRSCLTSCGGRLGMNACTILRSGHSQPTSWAKKFVNSFSSTKLSHHELSKLLMNFFLLDWLLPRLSELSFPCYLSVMMRHFCKSKCNSLDCDLNSASQFQFLHL